MDGTEGGKIVVTAPAESSTGRVIVLLSDGESKRRAADRGEYV